jgi:hypothetical protein
MTDPATVILGELKLIRDQIWWGTVALAVTIIFCSLAVGLTIQRIDVHPPAFTHDILIPGGMD